MGPGGFRSLYSRGSSAWSTYTPDSLTRSELNSPPSPQLALPWGSRLRLRNQQRGAQMLQNLRLLCLPSPCFSFTSLFPSISLASWSLGLPLPLPTVLYPFTSAPPGPWRSLKTHSRLCRNYLLVPKKGPWCVLCDPASASGLLLRLSLLHTPGLVSKMPVRTVSSPTSFANICCFLDLVAPEVSHTCLLLPWHLSHLTSTSHNRQEARGWGAHLSPCSGLPGPAQ